MKIIDIDTMEVIREYDDGKTIILYSKRDYWENYEKQAKEYDIKQSRKFLFEE